jgi:hypothetical protein
MSEQDKMDALLREAMGRIPPPALPSAFDRKLAEQLQPRGLSASGRWILALYALLGFIVCIWVMRNQSVDWLPIGIAILAPLAVVAIVMYRQRQRSDSGSGYTNP